MTKTQVAPLPVWFSEGVGAGGSTSLQEASLQQKETDIPALVGEESQSQ